MKIDRYKKIWLPLVLIFVCAKSFYGQGAKISTLEEITRDVRTVPCKNEERLAGVKNLFINMGAKESEISVEKFKDLQNVVVKVKGKSDQTIIVGAHYDKVKDGCGAIDNWTGIVILANLYKTIVPLATEKSYVFVAFDKEELGLQGSRAMVNAFPKENYPQYCSMVNFDSFGFAAPQAPKNMANEKMIKTAKDVAKEMTVDFADAAIEDADADSSSFLGKKIPAITFDGLSNNWTTFLHTSNDKIENINMKSVYLGYRFGLSYLAKIDALDCKAFK